MTSRQPNFQAFSSDRLRVGWWCRLAFVLIVFPLSGCAAFHPIHGVPASYVPAEYLGPSRSGKATIDLSLLVQTQPDEYRVAAKDVLSIYIPGVLGSLNVNEERQIGETPPINTPSNPDDPPTIGYPVTVRGNGTIALPYIPPINVHGMSVPEIEVAIRQAYTEHSGVLNSEQDRVLVSLQRRREYRVLVVRQETSSELTQGGQPGTLNIGNSKRGTATMVRLPAYENDVLHALASSEQGADGLPGLDAKNTIYIIRRKKEPPEEPPVQTMPPISSDHPPYSHHPALAPNPAPRSEFNAPPQAPPSQDLPLQTIPHRPSTSAAPVGPESITPQTPSQQAPIRATPDATKESTPLPNAEVPQQTPSGNNTTPEPQDVNPTWPAPANPPASIQRTSSETRTAQPPAVWPTIRSQSPRNHWLWGHSQYLSTPTPASFPAQTATTGMPPGSPGFGSPSQQAFSQNSIPSPMSNHTFTGQSSGQPVANQWPEAEPPTGYAAPSWPDGETFAEIGGHDRSWQHALGSFDPTIENPNVIKIPIRLAEGEYPTFTERDIILKDGDIVFIESRETEVFYTAGLLGGGQFTLPRDYDLRVLEAISIAQSQNLASTGGGGRSIGGVSALNQDVTISASHVVILRTLPNGTRIPIEVDLYKAVRRPQENILIQPGDLVILQYTKAEAVGAFFERHLLEGALFGIAATYFNSPGGGGN